MEQKGKYNSIKTKDTTGRDKSESTGEISLAKMIPSQDRKNR